MMSGDSGRVLVPRPGREALGTVNDSTSFKTSLQEALHVRWLGRVKLIRRFDGT